MLEHGHHRAHAARLVNPQRFVNVNDLPTPPRSERRYPPELITLRVEPLGRVRLPDVIGGRSAEGVFLDTALDLLVVGHPVGIAQPIRIHKLNHCLVGAHVLTRPLCGSQNLAGINVSSNRQPDYPGEREDAACVNIVARAFSPQRELAFNVALEFVCPLFGQAQHLVIGRGVKPELPTDNTVLPHRGSARGVPVVADHIAGSGIQNRLVGIDFLIGRNRGRCPRRHFVSELTGPFVRSTQNSCLIYRYRH